MNLDSRLEYHSEQIRKFDGCCVKLWSLAVENSLTGFVDDLFGFEHRMLASRLKVGMGVCSDKVMFASFAGTIGLIDISGGVVIPLLPLWRRLDLEPFVVFQSRFRGCR